MKILVIQQQMIGDVLTSSILFEALRKKYPDAELHYLIYKHTLPVVENNPYIDRCILYEPGLNKNPIKFLTFLRGIRQMEYTDVIDVYSKISTGLISLFSAAEKRLSYEKKYTSHFYSLTFEQIKEPDSHAGLAIENRMQFLQGLFQDHPKYLRPKIYLDESRKKEAGLRLEKGGIEKKNPVIMCGVLGSSKNKSYPPQFMASLLDRTVEQLKNAQILLNFSPEQKIEAMDIVSLCSPATRSRIFLNLYTEKLEDYITTCANCDLFIGNEGGAANIAKALSIPTFSIHSPSIRKNYWGIFNKDKDKVSVHLEDYYPELFQNKKNSEIKKLNRQYYQLFSPDLIAPDLKRFLKKFEV
ncbi:glycosyltransferase family 9 protein [Salinimicrobium soli]|uniref:glycosyltransferase family 9 protein n=1 Tax=Salinimicrobium soli TaxID=1254399 RepID=UPI003AB0723A